jgi:hypothetical protein
MIFSPKHKLEWCMLHSCTLKTIGTKKIRGCNICIFFDKKPKAKSCFILV